MPGVQPGGAQAPSARFSVSRFIALPRRLQAGKAPTPGKARQNGAPPPTPVSTPTPVPTPTGAANSTPSATQPGHAQVNGWRSSPDTASQSQSRDPSHSQPHAVVSSSCVGQEKGGDVVSSSPQVNGSRDFPHSAARASSAAAINSSVPSRQPNGAASHTDSSLSSSHRHGHQQSSGVAGNTHTSLTSGGHSVGRYQKRSPPVIQRLKKLAGGSGFKTQNSTQQPRTAGTTVSRHVVHSDLDRREGDGAREEGDTHADSPRAWAYVVTDPRDGASTSASSTLSSPSLAGDPRWDSGLSQGLVLADWPYSLDSGGGGRAVTEHWYGGGTLPSRHPVRVVQDFPPHSGSWRGPSPLDPNPTPASWAHGQFLLRAPSPQSRHEQWEQGSGSQVNSASSLWAARREGGQAERPRMMGPYHGPGELVAVSGDARRLTLVDSRARFSSMPSLALYGSTRDLRELDKKALKKEKKREKEEKKRREKEEKKRRKAEKKAATLNARTMPKNWNYVQRPIEHIYVRPPLRFHAVPIDFEDGPPRNPTQPPSYPPPPPPGAILARMQRKSLHASAPDLLRVEQVYGTTRREPVAVVRSVAPSPAATPRSEFSPRTVVLHKSPEGYGFVLRGAKSPGKAGQQPLLFQPTPEFPALQYLDSVDPGSQADAVGLKSGDFILEINGENVVQASHERVVHIIRSAQASLVLKVVTVRPTERSADWFMHQDGSMTLPSRKKQAPAPPKRDPHTSLSQSKATSRSMVEGLAEIGAIETLDQTLAEFEKSEYHRRHSLHNAASEEQKVASVRSTHSAKRMSCVELDNLMTGDHGARPHTAGGSPRGAREYMSPSELRIKKYHKKQGSGGMERSKSTPDLAADPESGGGGPPEVIYMGATVQQGRGAAGHNAATWSKAHAVGGGATPREPIYMQTGIAGEVRRPAAYLDPRAVQAGVYAGTMPRAGRGPREPVPVPVPVPPPQQDALGVPALPGRAPVPKRPAPPPPTASHEVVRVQPRPETTYANVSEEIQLRKKQESPYESSFRPGTSARLSTQPLVTTAALEQAMLKHRKTHSNGSAASQGQEAGAKAEGDKPSVTFAEDKVYESAASFLQKHPNATLLVTADVHAGDGRGGRGKTYYEPEPDYDTEDRHDSVSLSSSTAAQASLPTSRRSSSTLSTGSGCRVEVGGQDTPPLQQHHFQEASPSAAPSSSVTVIAIGGQRESPQMRRSSPQMRRESPLMARQSHYASLQEREAGPGAQSQRYTIHSDIPSSKPPSSSTPAPGVGVSVTSAGSSKMFIPPRPPEPAPKPPSASTSRRSSIQSNQSSGDREHPPEPPVTHTEPPTHAPPPPPPPPPPPMMAPLRTSASAGTLIEKRPPAGVVDSSGPGSMIPTQDILAAVAQRKARMETDGPRMSAAPAPAAKPAAKTQIELNQEALKKAVARRKDMLENADNVSIVESIEGRLMRTKKLQSGKYFFSSDTIARDKRKSEDLDKGKAGEPAADQGKDVSPTQTPAPSKSPASGQPEKLAYSAPNNTAPTPAPPPVLDVKLKPLNAGPTSQPKPIFEMSSKPPATPAPAPGVSKVTVNATKTAPPPPPQKSSASPGNASPPTKPAEMKPPSPKPPAPVPPAGDGKKAVAPPPPTSPTSHGKVAPPPPPPQTAAEKKQSDFLALAAKAREEWLQKKGASGSPSHGGEDAHTLPRPAKASATITVGDSPPRGGEEEDPSKTSIRSRIANFEKGKGSLNGALSRSGNNLELGGVTEDDSYTDYTLRRGQNRNSATGNGVADYVAPPPGFGDVDSGSHPGGKVHIDIIPPPASFGGSGSTGGSSPGTEGAFGHDDAASLVSSVSTLSELSSEQGEGRSGHHHDEIFAPPPPGFDDHGEDCQDMPPPPQFGGDGPGSRRGAVRPFQAKAVEAWLCTDVLDWLDSLGMGHYKDNFARNCIDGPKLAGLGRNDYIELGVTQVGHRMNLERSIKKLVVQKAGQV